ncbi:MAG: winged helix-turn-helix domain-containing protein, partial [Alphaproteobacteria bacterium]
MTRPLSLRLLGSFAVIWPAGIVLPTRKAGALLAYLAMPAGQPRPRGELATLLWGSRDDRQARHSLNQAVSSLRKLLSPHLPGLLQFDLQTVALNPGLVDTDVARLEAALANGAHGQVAEIYGGELLQGLDIR